MAKVKGFCRCHYDPESTEPELIKAEVTTQNAKLADCLLEGRSLGQHRTVWETQLFQVGQGGPKPSEGGPRGMVAGERSGLSGSLNKRGGVWATGKDVLFGYPEMVPKFLHFQLRGPQTWAPPRFTCRCEDVPLTS